jgi:hypothetical protein
MKSLVSTKTKKYDIIKNIGIQAFTGNTPHTGLA